MELRVVLYGDDIHAFLGEHMLQYADVMIGHVDEESSIEMASVEEHADDVDRVEIPAG